MNCLHLQGDGQSVSIVSSVGMADAPVTLSAVEAKKEFSSSGSTLSGCGLG